MTLDEQIQNENHTKKTIKETITEYKNNITEYWNGCINPKNAYLYGTFQERAALNITQFPKIQGSLLIRMGLIYPVASQFIEYTGIPKDAHNEILGMTINYHTWTAGYLAYLIEIQAGLSKYAIEEVTKGSKYMIKQISYGIEKFKHKRL